LVVLGTLRRVGRSSWRAHEAAARPGPLLAWHRWAATLLPGPRLQQFALAAMALGLAAYVIMTLSISGRVGSDVGILCLGLLAALLLVLGLTRTRHSLSWVDRAAAYVGVVMIVYLDQTAPAKSELVLSLSWTLLGVTGAAALVRFWLSSARRFELTSLDVLVIFIAVVLPNLPGSVPLPADLPAGITKAVILLYVVEALLGLEFKRALPRAALALTFGAIAARWLIAPIL
jgi:hypothetical protein